MAQLKSSTVHGDLNVTGESNLSSLKVAGSTAWHAGNDGTGSGLDADTVDGKHASEFAPTSHGHAHTQISGLSDAATTTVAAIRSGTTAANVGLGNVPNWTATAAVDDASDTKFATAGAVKKAYDKVPTWGSVTEKPETATRWPTWAEVSSKPGTFAPSAHTHDYLPFTGGTLTGYLTVPTIYASNWFRSTGTTGWYNETYGGGIYMVDTTWVRVYNSKALYVSNQIAATGNITAYYSDKRLKENIVPIQNALDAVCTLSGVRYNANALAVSYGYDGDKQEIGLLAQEVQKVVPEAVEPAPFDIDGETGGSLSGEHYLTLKYERMVPLLVEAIKELVTEVNELKEKLNGDNA